MTSANNAPPNAYLGLTAAELSDVLAANAELRQRVAALEARTLNPERHPSFRPGHPPPPSSSPSGCSPAFDAAYAGPAPETWDGDPHKLPRWLHSLRKLFNASNPLAPVAAQCAFALERFDGAEPRQWHREIALDLLSGRKGWNSWNEFEHELLSLWPMPDPADEALAYLQHYHMNNIPLDEFLSTFDAWLRVSKVPNAVAVSLLSDGLHPTLVDEIHDNYQPSERSTYERLVICCKEMDRRIRRRTSKLNPPRTAPSSSSSDSSLENSSPARPKTAVSEVNSNGSDESEGGDASEGSEGFRQDEEARS